MFYNLILVIILNSLLFLLLNVVHGQFLPGPRAGQKAVLVGKRIYYIGGYDFSSISRQISPSDFFYFDSEEETWINLMSEGVNVPFKIGHTINIGGINQDLIFIIGGLTDDINLIYQFDTKTNKIILPIINGKSPQKRAFTNSVNYGGKIYMFSGQDPNDVFYNNFDILNTISMNWELGSLVNAPLPRSKHSSTLVNDVIYYIGGVQQGGAYVPMTDIYQYSITGNTWSLKKALMPIGKVVEPRAGHTAVLVNGKICVYGGMGMSISLQIEPMAMLDTITLSWSIPTFAKVPPGLVYHDTILLSNKKGFVAFGNDTTPGSRTLNKNFYIFDFEKLEWVSLTAKETVKSLSKPQPSNSPASPKSETTKPAAPTTFNPNQQSNNNNSSVVIGLSVGLVGVASVGMGVLIFIKYSNKKSKVSDNHGAEFNYNHYHGAEPEAVEDPPLPPPPPPF